MAQYALIFELSQDANINAQIAVAISTEAKYALGTSADPDVLAWATYALGNSRAEGAKYQIIICADPAISGVPTIPGDPIVVDDAGVQAAVTALVPTMVAGYKATRPAV